MPRKKELTASAGERSVEYKRARWKHWARWFGMLTLTMLNISLILSTVQGHIHHHSPTLHLEIASFLVVLFFDSTILIPLVMEVDTVLVTPETLTLRGLCWQSKIKWNQIVSFNNPIWLKFAIVRTPKCVYLLNKRDLQPIEELLETIRFKGTRLVN